MRVDASFFTRSGLVWVRGETVKTGCEKQSELHDHFFTLPDSDDHYPISRSIVYAIENESLSTLGKCHSLVSPF